MFRDLVTKKTWILVLYKKTLCLDKMAITFAYKVRWKSFLHEKVSTQKVASEFNNVLDYF
jgi:predicted phage-related endonuclease